MADFIEALKHNRPAYDIHVTMMQFNGLKDNLLLKTGGCIKMGKNTHLCETREQWVGISKIKKVNFQLTR